MTKALGLVSGGLDSSLAVLTLKRQGVDVTGIAFVTPFFNADKAIASAKTLDFPLIVEDISNIHLDVLKAPKYGYGRNMNPCIDCHALMFRLAGERMQQGGFDLLFSGEVLGQRPMSQNANALRSVANLSGFPERVLRPLSAKLLPETIMEKEGLVDRDQLLDIQGRSRKRQQTYAKEWGYHNYPASAGGCLLTEEGFSNQLRDLLTHNSAATVNDIELLKAGRQFRLSPQAKLVLGRNKEDNDQIQQLAQPEHIVMRCANFSGPLGIYCGPVDGEELILAAGILASYGKGKDEAEIEVLTIQSDMENVIKVSPTSRETSQKYILR